MAKAKNSNLNQAKRAKNDEFYTQYNDIAEELRHYTKHFENKVVFCNCDDPEYSKFWQYFETKFQDLKLKKLISTHYTGEVPSKPSYKLEYDGKNKIKTELQENGDFRSPECIEILKECDIVVTNPPFSIWREYITQLIEYEKKFLIIGNKNAIAYKEVFPLIKEDKVWMGYNSPSVFITPTGELTKAVAGLTRWFTNLDIDKRHDKLTLLMDYDINDYPKYDNYAAIEVGKVKDIPYGYKGVMGVPITFLDKYCPEQFEILGMCENLDLYGLKTRIYTSEECRNRYYELFNKKGTYDLNASGVINGIKVYHRLLIKQKGV